MSGERYVADVATIDFVLAGRHRNRRLHEDGWLWDCSCRTEGPNLAGEPILFVPCTLHWSIETPPV